MSALKNEDFRRLLMTPRAADVTPVSANSNSGADNITQAPSFSHRRSTDWRPAMAPPGGKKSQNKKKFFQGTKPKSSTKEDKIEREPTELDRIMSNYRDRAKERRDQESRGDNENQADILKLMGSYKAVSHDSTAYDMEQQRRQQIEESKYLGGDMEHTHLVKGLDYALLQKVRSEITDQENPEDDDIESAYQQKKVTTRPAVKQEINHPMVKRIHNLLFESETVDVPTVRNEHFAQKRMAYVFPIGMTPDEIDFVGEDVPTTLLRSKAECPIEETSSLGVNDVVIQKLSQVLGYLRADNKKKKQQRSELQQQTTTLENKEQKNTKSTKPDMNKDLNIYDDVGDYIPPKATDIKKRDDGDKRRRDDRRDDKKSRDDDRNRRDERDRRDRRDDRRSDRDRRERDREREKRLTTDDDRLKQGWSKADLERERDNKNKPHASTPVVEKDDKPEKPELSLQQRLKAKMAEESSYMECYASMDIDMNAFDSDDEDLSSKAVDKTKRRIGSNRDRFTFGDDNQTREPMYTSKPGGTRAMRRGGGQQNKPKNDEKKLDKQWDKISKIIDKRKAGGDLNPEVAAKLAKFKVF